MGMKEFEDYPKNLLDLEKRFATNQDCLEYLIKIRWPNGFQCPVCYHENAWRNSRGLFECQKCGHQTSVTSGTILHQTRKPLKLWFCAMWHIANQKYGANALGLQRTLGLGSYNTAWQWLHKLRRAMVRPDRDKLTGVVEVDETYVGGKRTGKRGRGSEGKTLVAVAVEDKGEKGIGRIRLKHIKDASGDSLESFIKEMIESGATVRTDDWNGYNGVQALGYKHIIDPSNNMILAHRIISLMKRWLLGTYQGAVRVSHLSYYLDEYTFRFNRRASQFRGKLFYRLVQQVMLVDPAPLAMLKGDALDFIADSDEDFDHNI
jgi:transposase-like protein/Zn ribbon nucleic-acid-binding protein